MILEPPATGEWTVEDLESVETGDCHVELDQGQMLIRPAARPPWESRIMVRLFDYFEAQSRLCLGKPGVRLPSGARTPDLGVFHREPEEVAHHPAEEFAIVVEVASAGTSVIHYRVKPAKYAEGGIPEFWIVDRDPDDPSDALVRIHHLVTDTGGPIYRLERTIRLSKLEQE